MPRHTIQATFPKLKMNIRGGGGLVYMKAEAIMALALAASEAINMSDLSGTAKNDQSFF